MTGHSSKKDKDDKRKSAVRWRRTAGAYILALAVLLLSSCQGPAETGDASVSSSQAAESFVTEEELSAGDVPDYSGQPYTEVDDGEPDFTDEEMTEDAYESYSDLDSLGRCQQAEACVGQELMSDEERESISDVKPTGWKSVEYDEVDGGYLYNRCHLIGYQLTAENANEKNLITGTRYMNVEGMLPFEDEVADYVEETDNHVMYRVTPIFEGDNLVASGVWMEAKSVEDDGRGVSFNVYVYNVQPGIEIDYTQGDSWESDETEAPENPGAAQQDDARGDESQSAEKTYILNTNTMKFHDPDCSSASDIKPKNKEEFTGKRQELLDDGYAPCARCNP